MKPPKIKLEPYIDNLKGAAAVFGRSERTVRRWMQDYGIYKPKSNFGPNKLTKDKVNQIRILEEQHTQTELATMFGVTQATIGRVLNNIYYRRNALQLKGTAQVKVWY